VQSGLQKKLRDEAIAGATILSQRATPELLSIIDLPAFRNEIASLPIAKLPAQSLLDLYRDQARLSPIIHNLPADQFPFLFNTTYMLNDWEIGDVSTANREVEEFIETSVFPGYPAFPNLTCQSQDCQQRPNYFILDNQQWANGYSMFGDVSMALKPAYGRNLSVLLPMDTGTYAGACEGPASKVLTVGGVECNCSAWKNFSVGTFDAFDHVTLAGLYLFTGKNPAKEALAQIFGAKFQRMFFPAGQLPPSEAPSMEMYGEYIEVMTMGNVLIPEGVSYIVAQFGPLFGSETGRKLVAWAKSMGIGVAWAPGADFLLRTREDLAKEQKENKQNENVQKENGQPVWRLEMNKKMNKKKSKEKMSGAPGDPLFASYPFPTTAQLFLDPTVQFVSNASTSAANVSEFRTAWSTVSNATNGGHAMPASWWAAQWRNVYALAGPSLRVHYLQPGLCENADACFGVDDALNCLCMT
jgi:hypothetical protein